MDALKTGGVNRWQLIGVEFTNGAIEVFVAVTRGLEKDAKLIVVLNRAVLCIETLAFQNLRARSQPALHHDPRHGSRLCLATDGCDVGKVHHCCSNMRLLAQSGFRGAASPTCMLLQLPLIVRNPMSDPHSR